MNEVEKRIGPERVWQERQGQDEDGKEGWGACEGTGKKNTGNGEKCQIIEIHL